MKNNITRLNDSELEDIVGGTHYYVDKSHPVTGRNGKLFYNVYSFSTELSGDWQNLFNGQGASGGHVSTEMGRRAIPVEKYAAFYEQNKDQHTFHEC